jgi:hypothetical protein
MVRDRAGKSCNHIKHVILALNMAVLETWWTGESIRHDIGIYQTTEKFLNRLNGLVDLRVHLCYRKCVTAWLYEDMYPVRLEIGYGELREFLANSPVKKVTIDTTEVDWAKYRHFISVCTGSHIWRFQAESVKSFHSSTTKSSLPLLPNVRRLACPPEVIFCHCLDSALRWSPYPLPDAIEVLEIIDSTRLLNHWARCVLEHPAEYPNLKRVVLWCDRLSEPLATDVRLRKQLDSDGASSDERGNQSTVQQLDNDEHDPGDAESDDDEGDDVGYDTDGELDSEPEQNIPEELKLDDEGDEVWEDLQMSGIEVVVHFKQDRGWRDA